jgi:hypothetical protein
MMATEAVSVWWDTETASFADRAMETQDTLDYLHSPPTGMQAQCNIDKARFSANAEKK